MRRSVKNLYNNKCQDVTSNLNIYSKQIKNSTHRNSHLLKSMIEGYVIVFLKLIPDIVQCPSFQFLQNHFL